jgi:tetrahydromethanopterin S-methyltransferase subunit G
MTDETSRLVLEHLWYIRTRLDSVEDAVQQLTMRFGAVEGHMASFHLTEATQNSELDRVKQRLDRIERRLELQAP